MIQLPVDCSKEVVLKAVRDWVELLAKEEYEEAFDMVYHGHSSDQGWTPELLKSLVSNYGSTEARSDGRIFRVTSLLNKPVKRDIEPRHEVTIIEKNRHSIVGHVEFDLPINAEWSDLTATFNILEVDESWVLWLEDIHVL